MVNTYWGPGSVNTNWGPGLVNTSCRSGPVNTNWGPSKGPGPGKHKDPTINCDWITMNCEYLGNFVSYFDTTTSNLRLFSLLWCESHFLKTTC